MALLTLGIVGALGLGGAFAGALVGDPFGPYVCYPRYAPSFNPWCCQPYSYPMMSMGTGIGMGGMGMVPGFYPWSPIPWFQPSIFGY